MMRLVTRQRRGLAFLSVIALVMVTLGYLHRGVPSARVELNDGGVWVTNTALRLIAHLNYPSRTLDGGVRAASGRFDVTQHANTVLVHDLGNSRGAVIDTAMLSIGEPGHVPDGAEFGQGGETAAVLDPAAGKLWLLRAADIGSFSPSMQPASDQLVGGRLIVGVDGVATVVLPNGKVHSWFDGVAEDADEIIGISDLATAELTVVGREVVVLDRASNTIRTSSGSTQLTAAPAKTRLQQPSAAADAVLVAQDEAYGWAPLAGGDLTSTSTEAGAGTPAAPVVVGGCAYLAWGGSGAYVRDCASDADDRRQSVDRIKSSTQLTFRVNRDVVVLNDVVDGTVLLVNDNMRQVDNWKPIDSQLDQQEKEDDEAPEEASEMSADLRKEQQTKPVAQDDQFGARAGRSVTLPVLANDSDADGDLLTASVGKSPAGMTVSQVRGGEALTLAVPKDARGSVSFTYAADDGRGGTDEARVDVTIAPDSTNEAPEPIRKSAMTVGQRAEVSYSVLADWLDPEGDSVFLEGVKAPGELEVRFRADGRITVRDQGTGGPGVKDVKVFVSDGTTSTEGTLRVTVRQAGNVPPVANSDHVTVLKGHDVVVDPLANDTDANGDVLRLSQVQKAGAGQKITPDYANGTFVFSSSTVGTVYLLYQVTDGPSPAEGWVRVDVVGPVAGVPLAADDMAILPSGGSVVVEPLANDTDPSGGVLVLQSVDVPNSARALAVEIVDHGGLRVSAPTGLTAPVNITYVVANASGVAKGRVAVMPLPATSTSTPPLALDDRALVRVGDIVTIPVLDNDSSPSGLSLTVDPVVTIEGDESAGDAFASRNTVRFRANQAGTTRLQYTVRDASGNYDSAEIVIAVTALEARNQPPQPQPLVGRVLAGGQVTISVPTDGVDPDGDSVTLVGLASGATKGTAVATATGIVYDAPASTVGTDSFTYEVKDRFGARGTATIRVGIAPVSVTNQSPVAVPDEVTTRPGRTLNINPVSNDVDPDGDALTFVDGSVKPTDDRTSTDVGLLGSLIEVTAPDREATLRYYYDVSDGRGGSARGVVTVRVSADAELKAPVALDDVVALADLKDAPSVAVDVMDNDFDPDGAAADLTLSVDDADAEVSGTTVTIPVNDQRQVILYSVTDVDGLVGRAAIVVPPAAAMPPYLDPDQPQPKVKAGELLTIGIADYVVVRSGRSPKLTFAAKVKAGPGANESSLIKDDATLQFQTGSMYSGLSSITFEVTDGADAEDPNGLKSLLTLPITVESSGLHPPVLRPSDITVEAGQPAKTVDLRQMVTDEDPGDRERLAFTLGRVDSDFEASIDGASLRVSAPADALGSTGTAEITVTDGSTEPVTATLSLTVSESTRPLLSVTTAVVNDAKAGQPTTIDLADHITNPFADDGKPVDLIGQPKVKIGSGTVSTEGLRVTVTPGADFHGQIIVTYVVGDATHDPGRRVNGSIQLTVRARPDAPTGVVAETHLSRTATVSWTAGASNGSPITSFTVAWSGGSKKCGQATTCTISTLKNNEIYVFTVTATNEVGTSDPSGPSNQVRPDIRPDPPGTPVGTFGDGEVALKWAPSHTDGSDVTSYSVRISPAADGVTEKDGITGTSYTWTGLTNGVSYAFEVQAHSSAEEPSDWSGASAAVVPAGLPARPAAPSVVKDPVSALPPSATVRWTAPDANGDANLTYQLRQVGSTKILYSGTGLSTNVTLAVSTGDQQFEVTAENKAGVSQWSPASNAVRGWQVPGPVTGLAVTPTGSDNTAKITFGAANGNGALPSELTYYWAANGVTQQIPSGGATVTNGAFVDGENASVAVYAVARVDGESAQGESTSATVNTYGPPVSPSMSCGVGGTSISCSWSGGDGNGRTTSYALSGDATGAVGPTGSYPFGDVGYSATRTLCIQATQNTGVQGARNCDAKTSDPMPPSSLTKVSVSGLSVTFRLQNYAGAGSREIRCWNAATWETRKWPIASTGDPGNYLGTAGFHTLPVNGDVSVSCAGNSINGAMRPDGNFSIEVVGYSWYHIGN